MDVTVEFSIIILTMVFSIKGFWVLEDRLVHSISIWESKSTLQLSSSPKSNYFLSAYSSFKKQNTCLFMFIYIIFTLEVNLSPRNLRAMGGRPPRSPSRIALLLSSCQTGRFWIDFSTYILFISACTIHKNYIHGYQVLHFVVCLQ